MQAATAISSQTFYPEYTKTESHDSLTEFFIACILNTGVCLYQLSKERLKHLNYTQILKLSFKVTHPLIPTFALISSVVLIGNLFLSVLNKKNEILEKLNRSFSRFVIVNTLSLSYFTLLFHELGHASLASLFFKNSRVKIIVFPFLNGETRYAISYGLTRIGSFFGKDRALLLITAGGFFASMTTCFIFTHTAKNLTNDYPFLAEILQNVALSQILAELTYAISSIIKEGMDIQNDYTYLVAAGIHPVIPISLMAAQMAYSIYSAQST